jgi:hypothetical protein
MSNDENLKIPIGCTMLTLLLCFMFFVGGAYAGRNAVRQQAVERGYAVWVATCADSTTFVWKEAE